MSDSKPQRIQLSRRKGWRMPENTVKVDRSTRWGNPFKVGVHGNLVECLDHYREWQEAAHLYDRQMGQTPKVEELCGKNLACWCPLDQPCHADVLLELANAPPHE